MGKVKTTAESATPENPRERIGGNMPPPDAAEVTARMAAEYKALEDNTVALLQNARTLPVAVETVEQAGQVSLLVKNLRTTYDDAEAFRKKEKDPYFRSAQAVDAHFNAIKERLEKAEKILTARVHVFNQRLLAEERAKREKEAAEAKAIADAALAKLAAEQAAANEAAAAAARARKPENIEAHEQKAEQHAENAAEARVDAIMARDTAEETRLAAGAKSADIVRARHAGGATSTMRQVGYVEIVDRTKLNKELLWAHFKEEHILQALKLWAKSGSYKTPMDGAIIEMRDDTVIL